MAETARFQFGLTPLDSTFEEDEQRRLKAFGLSSAPKPQTRAPNSRDLPRGFRNNNPLNIEAGPFAKNMPGFAGSDGRFAQFQSMDDGIGAADRLLTIYARKGISSVDGVIGRWAPKADHNDTDGYAAHVANRLGVKPGDTIDLSDPATRKSMISAMAEVENGRPLAGAPSSKPRGLLQPGNIDLTSRPVVKNDDGSISTVRSISFEQDGKEILVPTVADDGTILSDNAAIDQYRQTGKHLGIFDNIADANTYADQLHQDQAKLYSGATEVDPVQSAFQQLEATEPGRYQVIDADKFDAWKQDWDGKQPSEFRKGFVGSLIGTNPKLAGDAVEGFGVLSDSTTMEDLGRQFAGVGERQLKGREARVPSITDIRTDSIDNFLADVGSYAGYQAGASIGTSAPSLVIGGATGLATANPVIGVLAGAAGPSYIQNFGDMWGAVRDDKGIQAKITNGALTRKQAAGVAAIAAVPMAALDALGVERVLGATVLASAKRNLVRRVVKGMVTGTIAEGSTEGVQQIVQEWALNDLGSDKSLSDSVISVVDNAVGGALGGASMGGGAGVVPSRGAEAAPEAPPPDQPTPAPTENGQPPLRVYLNADERARVLGQETAPPVKAQPTGALTRALQAAPQAAKVPLETAPVGAAAEAGTSGQPLPSPVEGQPQAGPPPGAKVTVSMPDTPPFEAIVDSYADGEALVYDHTGEIFQVPPDLIAPSEGAAPSSPAVEPGASHGEPTQIDGGAAPSDVAAPIADSAAGAETFPLTVGQKRRLKAEGYDANAMTPEEVSDVLSAKALGKPAVPPDAFQAEGKAPVLRLDIGTGKTATFPDATHADLFRLGLRRDIARRNGRDTVRLDKPLLRERVALAGSLGVDLADVNGIADDYRHRVQRRGKGADDGFDAPKLKTLAPGASPESSWWRDLTEPQREKILAEASVKRSPKVSWGNLTESNRERIRPLRHVENADVSPAAADVPIGNAEVAPTIDQGAHEAAPSPQNELPLPSEAQKKAGNYQKGHIRIGGLDISIENPVGSDRTGKSPSGKGWSVKMKSHYGYIRRTAGKDGDHVDVFVKEGTPEDLAGAAPVFVIDQKKPGNGHFDEHKVMLGYATEAEATKAYSANYTRKWKVGPVTAMPLDQFKTWLGSADLTQQASAAEKGPIGPFNEKDGNLLSKLIESDLSPYEMRQVVGGDMPLRLLKVVGMAAETETDYDRLSRVGHVLDQISEKHARTPYPSGKGKQAKEEHAKAVEAAARVRDLVEPIKQKIAGKQSALVGAAMDEKGIKDGNRVRYTEGLIDTRTGEPSTEKAEGDIHHREDFGAAEMRVGGGILFLTPDDIRNRIEKVTRPTKPKGAHAANGGMSRQEAAPTAPQVNLARSLAKRLADGGRISAKMLQAEASVAYGGTLAEGRFDRKAMYDALELAVNMRIAEDASLRVDDGAWQEPMQALNRLLNGLPTQTVRSEEQQRFQQFSTPPNYAAAAAYAANLRDGDMVLEPSAGTGSIVAAAMRPGVTIAANELSDKRGPLLEALVGGRGRVFSENAEQLNNVLPQDVKPTVVVMNPPFSQTAGRLGDKKQIGVGAAHVEQALKRLEPGGRLVAIVGHGMTMGAPKFRPWWKNISRDYAVRANIGLDGAVYAKYGTTFGTRLLVIDKVAPTGDRPVLTEAHSVDELMRALEPIRNARPEQRSAQPSSAEVAGAGEGARPAGKPAPADASGLGDHLRSTAGGVAGARASELGDAGQSAPRMEAAERNGLAPVQPQRGRRGRTGSEPVSQPESGEGRGSSGGVRAERDLEQAAKREPGPAASSERISLEVVEPGKQTATSEITESLYESYQPQRVRVPGAKPHPGPLVQSAAMASVPPPKPTYTPHLPQSVVSDGMLSLAQLEAVIYAGQAHEAMLPAAEEETPRRRGHFIGDGTGVGKGREISGIILDNFQQGRTKALWVSEKKTLLQDARRDWSGIGQNADQIFDVSKTKSGEPVKAEKGIAFITYDTLKGGLSDQAKLARGGFIRKQAVTVDGQQGTVQKVSKPEGPNKDVSVTVKLTNGDLVTVPSTSVTAADENVSIQSRVDQLVDWFGKDFDGVIAFDEAHNMANAMASKGDMGLKEAAQKALAGLALQQRLPNARVVYVSATGATEVSNLAYADRLGLWGRGTPFAGRDQFISEVEGGGIAAMELVARDMKQLGLYTARALSYDGVEYSRVEHKLDPTQREIYDALATAWQSVLENINAALELTGGNKSRAAKNAAYSAFWSTHQRFFNQIITSMQMPSVIASVEKDIAEKRQAVLQLTNTNEASQERAAAKATSAEEIEDLDITPRDALIQLIEKSFPTQQFETYHDQDGNERSRAVVDSAGNPVESREALDMREKLVESVGSVRVPQGPLDLILDHFGIDTVAEVTGRGRRFVMKAGPDGRVRRMEESRPGSANLGETEAFQAGKKRILVFSEAGGTGRSYHADNSSKSKNARRSHYLVQAGWRADKAVQGFGRTHRTNQASAPIFHLVTTDLQGQKRFVSSIARRLAQLGALTKGQRQAGDQGMFSARDNLESHEAELALTQFFTDLFHNRVENVDINDFERQTGLTLRQKTEDGGTLGMKQQLPPITQFLNRLLSLKIDMQNRVFDAFSDRMDAIIEGRRQAGVLDLGLETVKADKIAKVSEQVVHTNEGTGAETHYVKFELADRFRPVGLDQILSPSFRSGLLGFAKSSRGKIYALMEANDQTDTSSGAIFQQYRLRSPTAPTRLMHRAIIDSAESKWEKVDQKTAGELWKQEIAKAPEFITKDLHLVTGAILPIWDRLKGFPRVVRLQTDSGERYLGRVISDKDLAATMKALGAEMQGVKVDPSALFDKLLSGANARLANGWTIRRSLVAGEHRIELTGPSSFSEGNEVKADGVFTERINYAVRYFVPTEEAEGRKTLEALTKFRPVVELSGGREEQTLGSTAARQQTPPFYSGVLRAIDSADLKRGTSGHWLGFLKNQPGVKQEELDWLGVADWLKAQNGPVTKEALADFVRANQVEVKEVHKAGQSSDDAADGAAEAGMMDSEWANPPTAPKFATYQLPGGSNYRELLLTLPTVEEKIDTTGWTVDNSGRVNALGGVDIRDAAGNVVASTTDEISDDEEVIANAAAMVARDRGKARGEYRSGHWSEPNVLAHVRFNEREVNGKRVLFIEEVQSDWHQKGRKVGYRSAEKPLRAADEIRRDLKAALKRDDYLGFENGLEATTAILMHRDDFQQRWEMSPESASLAREWIAARDRGALTESRVPDAPFKTTWPELAMKRMIRWGAENGFDEVAWAPGDVQNERYNLSKHVSRIDYFPDNRLVAYDRNTGQAAIDAIVPPENLADYIGKDAADKLLADGGKRSKKRVLYPEDLKLGGEGMKGFYDRILPSVANKLGKKFGAKVEQSSIPTDNADMSDAEKIRLINEHGVSTPAFQAARPKNTIAVHSLPITPAMREAAMQGQPLFKRTGTAGLKPPPAERNALKRELSRRVKNIFGRDIRIQFADTMPAEGAGDANYMAAMKRYQAAGGSMGVTAGGSATFPVDGGAIIRLALADPQFDPRSSAHHEAYHAVEALLMTDEEFAAATTPEALAAARRMAAKELGRDPNGNAITTLPGYEARAIAFERYVRLRAQGMPVLDAGLPGAPALNRFFERLMRLLRGLRRWMKGEGYSRIEDVFEAVHQGKMAGRAETWRDLTAMGNTAARAQTETPAFKAWFGKSKVVDENGDPLRAYHGTTKSFDQFDTRRPRVNARNPSWSGDIGSWFAAPSLFQGNYDEENAEFQAESYAHDRRTLEPAAGANVMPVYLSIQNPKEYQDWEEFADDRGGQSAEQFRAKLTAAGHDGMVIRNSDTDGHVDRDDWVAFEPTQIKSAIGNRGTFDPNNPSILAKVALPRNKDELVEQLQGMAEDRRMSALAVLPLNVLSDFARPGQTAPGEYLLAKREMDAYRGKWHNWADEIVDRWRKHAAANPQAANALGDLMHDTTLAEIDPTKTTADHQSRPGYAGFRKRYNDLPAAMKAFYAEIRDAYLAQTKELDDVIIENIRKTIEHGIAQANRAYDRTIQSIKDSGLSGDEKADEIKKATQKHGEAMSRGKFANKARLTKLRQSFEANRIKGPYFPLGRFGQYFATVRDVDGTIISFTRFEKEAQRRGFVREVQKDMPHVTIATGVLSNSTEIRAAMDPRVIAEITSILGKAGVEAEVMDAIWQRYLAMMPDLSIRKRFIHRKGTAGFHTDALRVFGSHMFHAAHQMGKLKYSPDLAELVNLAEEQAKSTDNTVIAGKVANELRLRHQWVLNPVRAKWASTASSIAFLYYLGTRPSAAIVNLTQTTMLGIPILGARFGVAQSSTALGRAAKDFAAGKGSVTRANLTDDERAAMQALYDAGVLDRSQALDLAGVAEEGLRYSPLRARVMAKIAWLFHNTERLNREVTSLAAYRMARKAGENHVTAIRTAGDLTWKTHFDYSNTNVPRLMQNDLARAFLTFKNFQINMLYRLFRDAHQSFKGESRQARKEARYQLAGIMGMMALHAGLMGTPFIAWVVIPLWGMVFGDADDPMSSEGQFRRDLLAALGPQLGGIVLDGVPGYALGIDLVSRIGMPDLFYRSDDRDRTAQDWWDTLKDELGGPLVGIVDNLVKGWSIVQDGKGYARGIEAAGPRFVGDALKAWRTATEGVLNLKGDPLVPKDDVSAWDVIATLTGFTPAKVAEQYRQNTEKKNMEADVYDMRRNILDDYFRAHQSGDAAAIEAARARIHDFNHVPLYRSVRITPDTLKQSRSQRRRFARKVEGGVLIQNERLNRSIDTALPEQVYQ